MRQSCGHRRNYEVAKLQKVDIVFQEGFDRTSRGCLLERESGKWQDEGMKRRGIAVCGGQGSVSAEQGGPNGSTGGRRLKAIPGTEEVMNNRCPGGGGPVHVQGGQLAELGYWGC